MTIDASAVARVLGITTTFQDLRAGGVLFLPQRIAVFAQGTTAAAYALTKFVATSAGAVGTKLGFGSPAHLIARELFPVNGDGVGSVPVTFYPLDDAGSSAPSVGDVTPSGSQTTAASYKVRIGGIESASFVIPIGASVADVTAAMTAAINAVLEMPMLAVDGTTVVDLTAKWAGLSANDLVVEVIGDVSLGTAFALTQPVGGLIDPDAAQLQAALAQVGDVWETMAINALEANNTTALGEFDTFGEGRWGALVRKPLLVFRGNTEATVATAIAVTDVRKADRTNCQLVAPGSPNLPAVVAARQVARIAVLANNNPPHDYGSQRATGILPGLDSQQWDFAERDQAVKGGSSTVEVKDGIVNISDVVTSYKPDGEAVPAYRFVVDIVKLQQIIFNLNLIFANTDWDGAPLIPDDQPTVNPTAKKPKMAKAEVNAMIDSLGGQAIISDPATAKKQTTAVIDSQNPKRLNVGLTVQLSGNTNIVDVDLNFGFFFGTPAVAA